jgi:hypothetical protein
MLRKEIARLRSVCSNPVCELKTWEQWNPEVVGMCGGGAS